jgi:hypothetical protein
MSMACNSSERPELLLWARSRHQKVDVFEDNQHGTSEPVRLLHHGGDVEFAPR